MVEDTLVEIINEERKNLRLYYFWQLLWGSVFLVLVFASSIFFGLHSKSFWIYIIIPLLVVGGFWAFVQSTRDSVNVKFRQRVLKVLVDRHFSDFRFYPVYNLKKQDFEASMLVKDVYRLYSRNALSGEVEDMPMTMCYVRIDKNTDRGVITAYSGIYVWVNLDFSLPEFGIYPAQDDVNFVEQAKGLQHLKTKLGDEFQVLGQDADLTEIIDRIGPDVLKYSHICSDPSNFYLTTFNRRLSLAFMNGKDLIDLPLSDPISVDQVEEQIKKLEQCLDFVHKLVMNLKGLE